MFRSAQSRFMLRGLIAALVAVSAVASTIWIDNPYVKLVSAFIGALAAYLGIGAVTPQAEPFVGIKADTVEVPGQAVENYQPGVVTVDAE